MREMKDSGVEWIGEIPEDWTIFRTKFLCNISTGNKDTVDRMDEGEFPFFVRSKSIERINTYSYDGEAVLTVGDGDVGEIFHYINGKFNFHQRVYKFSDFINIKGKFFYYYISANFIYELGRYSAKTTVESLRLPWIKNFPLTIPSMIKQKEIITHLDEKTAHIDNIIEKTKGSIKEYKKYKQSLITETVTKGLNPDVKMKDSGIEWIGEIPEHWEAVKMKHLFEIVKRIAGTTGHDVLSITQQGLKVKDVSINEGQLSSDYSKYQFVYVDDFAMNHMDLLTGGVDLSTYNGVTSPDYRVFRLKKELNHSKEYYKKIFQICYLNKIFYGFGQGVSNLGRWRLQTDQFLHFPLPLPPEHEQFSIVEFLKLRTEEIASLILKKEKMLAELETYKKSLIYEVVTGKKEVSWKETSSWNIKKYGLNKTLKHSS